MGQTTKIAWCEKDRARFWKKVSLPPMDKVTSCWNWIGAKTKDGYGVFVLPEGIHTTAHRASYILHFGEVSESFQIDHLCRNRSCVNPTHLEEVTNKQNTDRGLRGKLPTHCKRGHLWTEENTLFNSNGRRQCRECRHERDRKRRDKFYWRKYRAKKKGVLSWD